MAIKRTKTNRKTPPKPNPDKDRFLATGGGPCDGLLYLARTRTVKDEAGHRRITSELPELVPVGGGAYRRHYDPENNTHTYAWEDRSDT
jgi:hypothetical protein